MKILFSSSTLILLIFLSTLEGGISSCTKDHTIYDTVTVTHNDTITVKDTLNVTDTVIIKDTVLTEEMVTAHPWKLSEVIGVLGGDVINYQRGGSSNTQSFDNEYITFNADKTGVLVDNSNTAHIITSWGITTTGNRTVLVYTAFNDGGPTTTDYTWDNVRFKDGAIHYDDYFYNTLLQVYAHSQEIRIPK